MPFDESLLEFIEKNGRFFPGEDDSWRHKTVSTDP